MAKLTAHETGTTTWKLLFEFVKQLAENPWVDEAVRREAQRTLKVMEVKEDEVNKAVSS